MYTVHKKIYTFAKECVQQLCIAHIHMALLQQTIKLNGAMSKEGDLVRCGQSNQSYLV